MTGREEHAPEAANGPVETTWTRWEEVDALLDRMLDAPPDRVEALLDQECGADAELRDTVLDLLSTGRGVGEDLGTVPGELVRAALDSAAFGGAESRANGGLGPGAVVGRYRIVREIGRGGMATVFEAERRDGVYGRPVALKVLRPGLDADDLVRRFFAERRILSGLAHPGIATLLDGGATEAGIPFLVMELVQGEAITSWADRNALPPPARIRLFLRVAEAVAHAHAHLVVHRDLKPSNVLVTDDGNVKLLDFGVAKLLDAESDVEDPLTRLTPAPITPEFASPEQLRGERITTASDVFQLGVLLYRMLAGRRPFEGDAVRTRLMGGEPDVARPSDVAEDPRTARALRGDLDTILLKAIDPEPRARYASVEALAADLERHLERRPIAARPASIAVRVGRFSRRNPWFWPIVATASLLVGGYVATVSRYSTRLEGERADAVAQAERAEALRSFMLNQFGSADPYSDDPMDPDVTVVEAMAKGAEAARRDLAGEPLLQAEMLSAIAEVYANLSLYEQARVLLEEAMSVRSAHGGGGTAEQVADLGTLGWVVAEGGQRDSARVLMTRALTRGRSLFGERSVPAAEALERLGWLAFTEGEFGESLGWYEEAVSIRRDEDPIDTTRLSPALAALADAYRWAGRWDEARGAAAEAHQLSLATFGDDHATTAQRKVDLAQVVHGLGDLQESIRLYREALPVLERTQGEQHVNTLSAWNNLGIVLDEAGDLTGAEEVQRRILAIRRERYGGDQHREVAASLQNLAANLVRQGRYAEADTTARRAERVFRATFGETHYSVAFSLITQTEAALRTGRGGDAERLVTAALDILDPAFGPGYPTAAARCRLGRAHLLQGREERGRAVVLDALGRLEGRDGVPQTEIDLCAGAIAGGVPGSSSGRRDPPGVDEVPM